MRKVHHKLTTEQKERGVMFSSTLSKNKVESAGDTVHEVMEKDKDKWEVIERLRDDKFFEDSCWDYNIIRS